MSAANPGTTRPAAVAGSFYPATHEELAVTVRTLLGTAPGAVRARAPKALVVPHAGYAYSGSVAARAYAELVPRADRVRRVVLLGPAHRVPVRGLALPGATHFATPLGRVAVDAQAVAALVDLPQVQRDPRAHAPEHALEVQLPFLQAVLGEFTLVPLVVGEASAAQVAEVLDRVWGGDETLIVVSSDLSHYLPYRVAQGVDRETVETMLELAPTLDPERACGARAINGLLLAAGRRRMQATLLDLRNSGDTAGDRERVVGYGSLAFYEPLVPQPADREASSRSAASARGRVMLAHARAAIATALGVAVAASPDAEFLSTPGATFVTLTIDEKLRGCVGSLEPRRALREDLRSNALAAAFQDARFAPLTRAEYAQVELAVSLLAPATPLSVADERELRRSLRPGVDGLVLAYRDRRATFLPQVWESLPDASAFVDALKRKLGVAADFWSQELRVSRYTVEHWSERDGATAA